MGNALEALQSKLESSAPYVERGDIDSARVEFRNMDDAAKQEHRETLLDLRYRVDTSTMQADAKAELEALQRELPERNTLEAAEHGGEIVVDWGKDAGQKALDVAGEMGTGAVEGGKQITESISKGDIRAAVTHPMAATILGVLGITAVSRWILNTKEDNTKTSWWWQLAKNAMWATGLVFAANVVQKYSR